MLTCPVSSCTRRQGSQHPASSASPSSRQLGSASAQSRCASDTAGDDADVRPCLRMILVALDSCSMHVTSSPTAGKRHQLAQSPTASQPEGSCLAHAVQGSYSPLFLSKADLDLAVENVFSLRDTKREAATQAQFKAASQDLAVAEAAVRPCPPYTATGGSADTLHDMPTTACGVAPKRQCRHRQCS